MTLAAHGPAYRVLVCGTRFGEHYLSALRETSPRLRLAGILANGSPRSRALAESLAVPLYTSVTALPEHAFDIACVVVRSSIVGGAGTTLASQLLERRIHVLQEHPVDPRDVASLCGVAERFGVRYHLNTLYPHLPAPRAFIEYVQRWRAGTSRDANLPAFVELTTSPQLLFSSLDILARAVGGFGSYAVSQPAPLDEAVSAALPGGVMPFKALHGVIAGLPFQLNLQAYLDPRDPDHHSLVMHRLAIGGAEGSATLVNSFGPTYWSHSIYQPHYERNDARASFLLHPEEQLSSRFVSQPTATELCSGGAPLAELARRDIPQAIRRALDGLLQDIERGGCPAQSPAELVALSRAWLLTMQRARLPSERHLSEPPPPVPDPRAFAAEFARREQTEHA